jgi:hypothetical protein
MLWRKEKIVVYKWGSLVLVEYNIKGISFFIQDGTWWTIQWIYWVQYQVDSTLMSKGDWFVQKVLFARLQEELWERSYSYLQVDGPTNGSLQNKDIPYQSKNNYLSGISNGTLYMMQSLTQMWQG